MPDSKPGKQVILGDHVIGIENPCFLIAEIGVNHNGDYDLALKTIDQAAKAKAQAVKFQTFSAEEFVADPTLEYSYTLQDNTKVTETQYDMFKRLELPVLWHKKLKDYANSKGLVFLSSSADKKAVDLLAKLDVPAFKLASEDLINIDLLRYTALKQKPIILSTGMASEDEIHIALEVLRENNCPKVILLHCTSAYPTPFESCNLSRIQALRDKYNLEIGFSDHSQGWQAAMVARSLGAVIIEKHFTLDKSLAGPDHCFSADPQEFAQMAKHVRECEALLGNKSAEFDEIEKQGRLEFRRSIVACRDIPQGSRLTLEMLAYKRPGQGLKPFERDLILGRKTKRYLKKDEKIALEDVE